MSTSRDLTIKQIGSDVNLKYLFNAAQYSGIAGYSFNFDNYEYTDSVITTARNNLNSENFCVFEFFLNNFPEIKIDGNEVVGNENAADKIIMIPNYINYGYHHLFGSLYCVTDGILHRVGYILIGSDENNGKTPTGGSVLLYDTINDYISDEPVLA